VRGLGGVEVAGGGGCGCGCGPGHEEGVGLVSAGGEAGGVSFSGAVEIRGDGY
jgi:hypothetical protein